MPHRVQTRAQRAAWHRARRDRASLAVNARSNDPTHTITLRAEYARKFSARFLKLKGLIREAIIERDVFGLTSNTGVFLQVDQSTPSFIAAQAPERRAFDFPTNAAKHDAFMDWLRGEVDGGILEQVRGPTGDLEPWTNTYVRRSYDRGIEHAGGRLRDAGVDIPDTTLHDLFNRPIHADKLAQLYTRNFEDLRGITQAMDRQISRTLADGLARGDSPVRLATLINRQVDGIGRRRAQVLARTEVIRAHAEATLNRYSQAGVKEVVGSAEFRTAGDTRVCSQCEALEAHTYKIDEARGVIPVHPSCRCSWWPVTDLSEKVSPFGRRSTFG